MTADAGHPPFEGKKKHFEIELKRKSEGGENIDEPFAWTGVVAKAGEIEVYRS